MEIIRTDYILKYPELADYCFIDSSDIVYEICRLPKSSLIDAIRILYLKRKHTLSDTYVTLYGLDAFRITERYIITVKLNNYNSYITQTRQTVCPIEYVIMNYCKHIADWMFIVTRVNDTVKIVSGKKNMILNSRIVFANDIELEIVRTIKYINRFIDFRNIKVITNVRNIFTNNTVEFIENDDVFTMLAEYASKAQVYEYIFGRKLIKLPKYNVVAIAFISLLSLFATGIEYVNYRKMQNNYAATKQLLASHRKAFSGIPNTQVRTFLFNVNKRSFSNRTLMRIHEYIEDGVIEKIILKDAKQTVIGKDFSHEDLQRIKGKLSTNSTMSMQRIEIKI